MDYSKMRFPSALTVTELNKYVKDVLDTNPPLTDVFIKGEISNFKAHYSGHFYFSLKDTESALKCVMFRSSASSVGFMPEDGMKVIAHGRVSAYWQGGVYQFYADSLEPDGVGAMHIAVEQLKKKLSEMGLLDEGRKKPLPKIPSAVGVVTSPTGAAVRDIINVCGRRFPFAELVIYPAQVQGEGAAESVAAGIEYFNKRGGVDVLIVGRGGGSIEDLWAFNTETVALAVSRSQIPVISAVGHETDVTVCDLVADRRAPTPSAAAELAVPETERLKVQINNIVSRESAILLRKIGELSERLEQYSRSKVLRTPDAAVNDRQQTLDALCDRLELAQKNLLRKNEAMLKSVSGALSALNPLSVLSRGYSAAFSADGRVIKNAADLSVGDRIKLRMLGGSIDASVDNVQLDEK